jgi:hypothetical protein
LGSIGISVPLFLAFSRAAQYYTAKDAALTFDKNRSADGSYIKLHKESVTKHAAIFFISLGFLAFGVMSPPETARLAICASLIVKLRHRRDSAPLAAENLDEANESSMTILFNYLQPVLGTISIAWYIGTKSTSLNASLARVVLGATVLMAVCISRELTVSTPCKEISAPHRSRRFHPIKFLYVFFCTLQAMLVWKYVTFEGGTSEVSLGFKNFRSVLSDPFTWVGILHMASLPIVILRGAE